MRRWKQRLYGEEGSKKKQSTFVVDSTNCWIFDPMRKKRRSTALCKVAVTRNRDFRRANTVIKEKNVNAIFNPPLVSLIYFLSSPKNSPSHPRGDLAGDRFPFETRSNRWFSYKRGGWGWKKASTVEFLGKRNRGKFFHREREREREEG